MTLTTYLPEYPLSSYIQMVWHWEYYAPPHTKERILPIGQMELTINLSDRTFNVRSAGACDTQEFYGAMVVGCQSDYFVIDTAQPTTILSVLFKPGGAFQFLGVSAKDLHNQIISLSDIWYGDSDNMVNQLLDARSAVERFHILETYLLQKLDMHHERHHAVKFALDCFASPSSHRKISQIQADIAISPTRFIQVFRDDVGLTPKVFSRLQRFHRVLDQIACREQIDWADVALQSGYYDQAHLINEFQKFAGISPSDYAPQSIVHNKNLPYFE